jgi:hypothetical protein
MVMNRGFCRLIKALFLLDHMALRSVSAITRPTPVNCKMGSRVATSSSSSPTSKKRTRYPAGEAQRCYSQRQSQVQRTYSMQADKARTWEILPADKGSKCPLPHPPCLAGSSEATSGVFSWTVSRIPTCYSYCSRDRDPRCQVILAMSLVSLWLAYRRRAK